MSSSNYDTDKIFLEIKNDRDETIATIVVENGTVVEEELRGCWIKDIDGSNYKINLTYSPETIDNFSTESLLDEIKLRVRQ